MKIRPIALLLALGLALSGPAQATESGFSQDDLNAILQDMEAAAPDLAVAAFSDVSADDWYAPYVGTLYIRGAIQGVEEGRFAPEGTVTAGEFLALAARLVMPERIDMTSAQEYWAFPYYDAIDSARTIWGGSPPWSRRSEHFDPKDHYFSQGLQAQVNRSTMAELLVALAEYRGERLRPLEGVENNLRDSARCDYDAFTAYSAGLITGKDDGRFDPGGQMTRAEMCAVFCRLMNYVPRPQVTVQPEPPASEYFYTAHGSNKGQLRPEAARKLDLAALDSMYVGQDEGGVYFFAQAPVLPQELIDAGCTVHYYTSPEKANGDFFTDHLGFDLASGESRKEYFRSFAQTPITAGESGSMRVAVSIETPGYESLLTHWAFTDTPGQVLEDGEEGDVMMDYDVSHLFQGIGR